MELLVSIAILVIIILAVGVTFAGASKAVGTSNATTELMSGVRSTQQLIERDFAGLDKTGFLVIRSRAFDTTLGDKSWRFDQLCFISIGSFPNRSGAKTTSPFTDSSVANAALIWWGQGVLETGAPLPDNSYMIADQSKPMLLNQAPTGLVLSPTPLIKEPEFTLMRQPRLLFPGPALNGTISPAGQPVMAYNSAEIGATNITGIENLPANIASSRYATIAQTPAQIMQMVSGYRAGGDLAPECDRFTFRFRALASIYDTEIPTNPFVNGYFRMNPIVMQGVSSFKIEWTDGKIYPPGYQNFVTGQDMSGQLKWYGPTRADGQLGPMFCGGNPNPVPDPSGLNRYGTDNSAADTNVEEYNVNGITHNGGATVLGDQYLALFTYTNRSRWPKAIRITMHIASDRLQGGRDFSQVINITP